MSFILYKNHSANRETLIYYIIINNIDGLLLIFKFVFRTYGAQTHFQ